MIHTIEAFATMGYYLLEEYWPVWSKVMMPGPGPPGAEFYAYSIAFAVVTGILYAFVFGKIKSAVPGQTAVKKGSYYGAILFIVAGIPAALSMYLLINLPVALIVSWAFSGLVTYVLGGIAIAKIMG